MHEIIRYMSRKAHLQPIEMDRVDPRYRPRGYRDPAAPAAPVRYPGIVQVTGPDGSSRFLADTALAGTLKDKPHHLHDMIPVPTEETPPEPPEAD